MASTAQYDRSGDATGFDQIRLGDLPSRAAARWSDRPAVHFTDPATGDTRTETHGEFAVNVDRTAKGLMALGVQSGEHVGLWMTNRPEWLHLLYAVTKIGACLVPLNTRYRSADMAYTVINSECSTLVTIDQSGPIDYRALLSEVRAEVEAAGHLDSIVMVGEPLGGAGSATETSWDTLLAGGDSVSDAELAARAATVDPDQLMMLAYTSGTTGHPKGVMHTHRPVRNIRERTMLLGHTRNDIHLNYLPLFHIYSLSEVAVMCAVSGSAQVLFDSFDPPAVLDAMESYRATVMHGFDSHWADLLAEQDRRTRDTSSLRVGSLAAGMKSSIPTARRSQEIFCPTISGFGMSESWAFICCSHPTDSLEQRTEASGYPMDGVEVEIRDPETGAVLPPDTPGVLYIKHFTVTQGYWANPEATADTIDAEGWLDTGDLASLRPDGHVVLIGRFKDMLKVGGENMSPAEVEGYLLAMDGVAEVAVVAYPDDRLSEVPVAYVVRTKDAGSGEVPLVSEDDLIAPLRGKIASYKIPRAVLFVDELPMTPSGKIRKVELRERALRDLA